MSLSCDFRLAAKSAHYSFPESHMGVLPASNGVSRLTRICGTHWARLIIMANVKVPAEWYASNYKLKVANQIASGATAIGFDASDLMPPAVGQGSFWTGISDWANSNGSNTDSVLQAIDDSWPK